MHVFFTILLCFFVAMMQSNAQQGSSNGTASTGHVPNELLVQLKPKASLTNLLKELARSYPDLVWDSPERLVPDGALWRLRYKGTPSAQRLLEQAWQSSAVELVQLNHYVSLRSPQATTPNDLLFTTQWQYINNGG